MPLRRLPKYVDCRLSGNAVSTLQSLAQLCQDDNDAMDAVEKIEALDRAAAKEILLARLIVHLP